MNPARAIAYRKQVAALLDAVILDDITPRTALNTWPTQANEDPSIQCAYTMLWYFEADEDRHDQELFYADLQVKLLQEACQYLRKGEPLPLELLHEYQAHHAPPELTHSWTWRKPWLAVKHLWHLLAAIVSTNPLLAKAGYLHNKRPRQ